MLLDVCLERREVGAVGFEWNAHHLQTMTTEHRDGPVVGRVLGEYHVAGFQQPETQELDDLQRTVAGQHAVGADALPLRDPLAERLEPG